MAEQHRQGFYDACDGKGWQLQATGLHVADSLDRDNHAKAAQRSHVRGRAAVPKFHVGQVISTKEEYAALPVDATVWPSDGGACGWHWRRTDAGYLSTGTSHMVCRDVEMECYHGRVIRSLPTEAA